MTLYQNTVEFQDALPAKGAIIGLDVSQTKIGIAMSDHERRMCSPHSVLTRAKFQHDSAQIIALCKAEAICGIAVGLPLNMDGTIGPRAQSCRSFALNLSRLIDIPVGLVDERLSTAQAHDMMDELGHNSNRRAALVDAIAAQMIVERVIEKN